MPSNSSANGLHLKSAFSSVSLPLSPLLIGAQQSTQDAHQHRLRIAISAFDTIILFMSPMACAQP